MSAPAPELVVNTVLADSGILVLESAPDGTFILLSAVPGWFRLLLGRAETGDVVELEGRFPFLDHFLHAARDHWRHGAPLGAVHSGTWIEVVGDQEVPLEATARRILNRPVLILGSMSERYERSRAKLQMARESLLDKEVLERAVRERTAQIRSREEEIAVRLVSAAEFRDSATGAHIRRIGRLTALLGDALRLPPELLDHIELAAAMHDVGKIGIPDHVLLKPGPLDSAEMSVMQTHTVMGARILEGSDAPALQLAQEVALSHHEHWDGSGYPNGMAGEEIPLVARIVAVVDFFDATVSHRPYRAAMTVDESLGLMKEARGRHFDPEVLDLFLGLTPQVIAIRAEVDEEWPARVDA